MLIDLKLTAKVLGRPVCKLCIRDMKLHPEDFQKNVLDKFERSLEKRKNKRKVYDYKYRHTHQDKIRAYREKTKERNKVYQKSYRAKRGGLMP